MKNDLDVKLALRAFNHITSQGKLENGSYRLGDMSAESVQDGYLMLLSDSRVSLSLGFHNQYHFDYRHEIELRDFINKLKLLAKS